MEMAKVTKCDVADCAYNMDHKCHTMAITVGDGDNPMCDTFCNASTKGGDTDLMAGVGACKVSGCKHNSKLECTASEITVNYKDQEADCMTFESS